jgi:hypothetical protein
MLVRVMFHGFFGMPYGMHGVAVRNVRMVTGFDVIAVFMVASGFAMMLGRVVMMRGCLQMMFSAFVLRHGVSPHWDITRRPIRGGEE